MTRSTEGAKNNRKTSIQHVYAACFANTLKEFRFHLSQADRHHIAKPTRAIPLLKKYIDLQDKRLSKSRHFIFTNFWATDKLAHARILHTQLTNLINNKYARIPKDTVDAPHLTEGALGRIFGAIKKYIPSLLPGSTANVKKSKKLRPVKASACQTQETITYPSIL